MFKKALVTGGAGFIGSHLCEELIKRGKKVISLDDLRVGTKQNLAHIIGNKNFEFHKGDVRNERLVTSLLKKVDIIFHLAAVVGVSEVVENRLENISVNSEGTKIVAEAAFNSGKKKVVFASSSEVYGKNDKVPLKEEGSEGIFGSTKVSLWAYGLAKALSEHRLLAYAEKGLPISIVRYFNAYGPRDLNSKYSNVVPKFINQALSGDDITVYDKGLQTRCFCYVSDTVDGTIKAAENNDNEIFNMGTDLEIKIIKLAKLIKKLTGSKSKIVFIPEKEIFKREFESSLRRVPDITKAEKTLGFKPKIMLGEGLKKEITYLKSISAR